jgi:hypothetical protein
MRTARSVVDKCTAAASRWFALVARMLLPAGLFAMSVFGAVPHTAHAQTIDPATKLAPDLVSALNDPTQGNFKWLKADATSVVMVQHGGSWVRAFLACTPILDYARRSIVLGSR